VASTPRTSAPASAVLDLPVDQIGANPYNPRRLFDEEPMTILRESVQKLGILVPLTVYQAPTGHRPPSEKFILLDGERRWRCAKELRLATIPANVVERPTETRNILTMFHIHNLREGWQLMPTALQLKTLMDSLKERNERKLHELTKLSISQIRRCKILLTYPVRFQNLMLAPPSERMKADFFIELERIRRPALTDRFEPWVRRGDAKTIEILLAKYEAGVIVAVTDFRHLAEIYKSALSQRKQRRLVAEFEKFLSRPEMSIDDIQVPGASFAKEAKEIGRSARRLFAQLETLEVDVIASDNTLVRTLSKLQHLINAKLEAGLLVGVRDDEPGDDPS
jgi:ParB family transcriptional regulator, chromosome partitioning protein